MTRRAWFASLAWVLVAGAMTMTYGAIYAEAQHWSGGWLSHRSSARDHFRAVTWAIFPPMWCLAPFITNGYEAGFQFSHHHKRFCAEGEVNSDCEEKP